MDAVCQAMEALTITPRTIKVDDDELEALCSSFGSMSMSAAHDDEGDDDDEPEEQHDNDIEDPSPCNCNDAFSNSATFIQNSNSNNNTTTTTTGTEEVHEGEDECVFEVAWELFVEECIMALASGIGYDMDRSISAVLPVSH